MTSSWLQTIFKRGPLVYSCWLAGRLYGRQWTTCAEGPPEAPLVFDLLLEIDPVTVGMGGKLLKRRCRLTTDRALIPLRFVSETSNGATTLAFEGERVQIALWDGSKLSVPRGASTFALDKSLPGLLAIMLAELVHRGAIGAPVALEVFDVAQYAPVPYQITPGAEGTLQTSHRETLSLDGPRAARPTRYRSRASRRGSRNRRLRSRTGRPTRRSPRPRGPTRRQWRAPSALKTSAFRGAMS